MTTYHVSGNLAPPVTVRGRFLTPGEFTLVVNGKPATVRFSREIILRAYDRLKARLAAGQPVEMRLAHPAVRDMPIRWGRVKAVAADRTKGDVWVTESEPLPEAARLMLPESWERLLELGLSFDGTAPLQPLDEPDVYEAMDLTVTAVDIVGQGAFAGSDITTLIPAGLAARLAAQLTRPGGSGRITARSVDTMPKLESVNDIPEDVRETLTPEQQQAYVAAYNAATEAGDAPEEAAKKALEAARAHTSANDPEKKTMKDEELKELQAKAARVPTLETEIAALKAKAQKADELQAEVKDLKARLAKERDEKSNAETELATLKAESAVLRKDVDDLKAEKVNLEVAEDVSTAIRAGRAVPAERESLAKIRRALGREEFNSAMKARPVVVPVGERGSNAEDPQRREASPERDAEELVKRFGVEGTLAAGLHRAANAEAVVSVLVAKHADHPMVQKHFRAELKAAKAKPKGSEA